MRFEPQRALSPDDTIGLGIEKSAGEGVLQEIAAVELVEDAFSHLVGERPRKRNDLFGGEGTRDDHRVHCGEDERGEILPCGSRSIGKLGL